MRLTPSPEQEERAFRWAIMGSVAFFLLALTSRSLSPATNNSQPKANPKNKTLRSVYQRNQESLREEIFAEVFTDVFSKIRSPDDPFLDRQDAQMLLPPYPEATRRVQCGGWLNNIPRLVLRFMDTRCPPYQLI